MGAPVMERWRAALADAQEGARRGGAGMSSEAAGRLLDTLLVTAHAVGASSLRLDLRAERAAVRLRVEGREFEIAACPLHVLEALQGAALLRERGLDVVRLPQAGGGLAVRIAFGGARERVPPLAELGFEEPDRAAIERVLRDPQGLVLVCGPAASGRTTTLYAMLDRIDAGARSVQTLESTCHRATPGWLQFAPAPASGADGRGVELSQLLRNAPDVLLVDLAHAAIDSPALARQLLDAVAGGCLVLAALPGERAQHALGRFRALGVAPQELAPHLSLVIAQRLVRRLCESCAQADDSVEMKSALARAANSWLDGQALRGMRAGAGDCGYCSRSGYRGRALLYEALVVDAGARAMIEDGIVGSELEQRTLREGRGIWDQGIRLMARGRTSLAALRESLREPG